MKRDKIRLYILEILLIVVLSLALFIWKNISRTILSIILTAYSVLVYFFIKNKKQISFYKKQVTILMTAFGVIYLIVFYLLGIYFGFYKAPTTFGWFSIKNFIFPLTLIIFTSEFIRYRLIQNKSKISKALLYISMVLIDLIVFAGVYNLNNLDDLLAVIGFILFASAACNLLYNYITERFGYKGIVIYRLMTVLYAYLIPYIPNVYIFFRSFLRMVYPFIIYVILEYSYSKTNYATAYIDKRKNIVVSLVVLVSMASLIALISCNFTYGILVIGSGSMTGTINKGDAIIFKQYKEEPIEEGMVLVFNSDNMQKVHRVIKVERVNGQTNYYTKGDANQNADDGYITNKDIVGIQKLRIRDIGWPTLWVRDIFS